MPAPSKADEGAGGGVTSAPPPTRISSRSCWWWPWASEWPEVWKWSYPSWDTCIDVEKSGQKGVVLARVAVADVVVVVVDGAAVVKSKCWGW